MAGIITSESIEEVRRNCDIVKVIDAYVPLKKSSGSFKACCPFHQEKTPSFTVNPARQFYYCFGCGAKGDAFKFVMEYEKTDFPGAVELLARRFGVTLEYESNQKSNIDPQAQAAARGRRERLYDLHQEYARQLMLNLQRNPHSPVAEYFAGRQIPMEIAERFMIGAATDSWDAALNFGLQRRFTEQELVESGLVIFNEERQRSYDRFRNRLTFAICDETGRVVGFSARTVEANSDGAKYVNSPETPIFKKGELLYALNWARQGIGRHQMAVLCEGQFDTIAMHRAGFDCAVAPQGTGFTVEQARKLKRYTNKVVLCFDADKAGRKASLAALEHLLPLDIEVTALDLDGGKDPDELFAKEGAEGVAKLFEHQMTLLDLLFDRLHGELDLTSPFGKSQMVSHLFKYLELLTNPVVQEEYYLQSADRLKLNRETMMREVRKLRQQLLNNLRNRHSGEKLNENTPEEKPKSKSGLPGEERHALMTLIDVALNNDELARRMANDEAFFELLSEGILSSALQVILGCTQNGEREDIGTELLKLLESNSTDPDGRLLGEILVGESRYSPEQHGRLIDDSLAVLRKKQESGKLEALLEELRYASGDSAREEELLRQIMELNQNSGSI